MGGTRIVLRRNWRPGIFAPHRTHSPKVTNPPTTVFLRRNWSWAGRPPSNPPTSRHPTPPDQGWGGSRILPRPKLEPRSESDLIRSAEDEAAKRREEEDMGWSRDALQAFLADKGSAAVLARFEGLAAAQLHTKGRAGTLVEAFKEMRALGIRASPAFYGLALAGLAIHPDYLLRATILDAMRSDWVEFTTDHRVHVVIGMLRDGQYEMAFDELEDLVSEKVPVPYWLFEILVFTFGKLGFLEEAMLALEYRQGRIDAPPASSNLLYYMLDACSAAYHYAGTVHFWQVAVRDGGIVPSDGTLLNVINTASRHADPELALEALRVTTDRKVQLSFQHFEPVIEAYAGLGELDGAFRMLCVMDSAGLRPGRDATRSVLEVLRDSPERVDEAVGILRDLSQSYRVPIAAINVVLEALCSSNNTAAAETLYESLPSITPDPPTVTTFHPFLTSPSPPAHICITAIESFPNLTLSPPELASLAVHLARPSLDAALAYLYRIDAVYKPWRHQQQNQRHPAPDGVGVGATKPDAWILHAGAVRALALEMLRRRDARTWEFFSEMGRRNPSLAAELRELGRGVGEQVAGEEGAQ